MKQLTPREKREARHVAVMNGLNDFGIYLFLALGVWMSDFIFAYSKGKAANFVFITHVSLLKMAASFIIGLMLLSRYYEQGDAAGKRKNFIRRASLAFSFGVTFRTTGELI